MMLYSHATASSLIFEACREERETLAGTCMFYLRMLHEICTEACIFAALRSSALQFLLGTRRDRNGTKFRPSFGVIKPENEDATHPPHIVRIRWGVLRCRTWGNVDHLIDCAP
ncbi:hypothetical protein XI05_18690 [Bradyrhizobium sp. CCBAU 11357]|nr:hypothetical protein [Bradyrhizobium sp. CCBAU 11357]